MNTRLKPPCWVEYRGKRIALRRLSRPNAMLKQSGWKGLVAHVQNQNGTGLAPYRELKPWTGAI